MFKVKIILAVIVLAVAEISFAKKFGLMIGGGGEQPGQPAVTDSAAAAMYKAMKAADYQITTVYKSTSPYTNEIFQQMGAKNLKEMTTDNVDEAISGFIKKIKSGEITSKDQIFLSLTTHGMPQEGEQTHSVATSVVKKSKFVRYSIDKFQELTKLANSKGIKMGFWDGSCFSGPTQSLASDNVCVISAAGVEGPSVLGSSFYHYNGMNNVFAENLKPGNSILSAFLDARKKAAQSDYPMISSLKKMSNGVFNELAKIVQSGAINSVYLQGTGPANVQVPICLGSDNTEKLKNDIENLRNHTKSTEIGAAIDELKKSIDDFENEKAKPLPKSGLSLSGYLKDLETLKKTTVKVGKDSYSEYELLSTDILMIGDSVRMCKAHKEQNSVRYFFSEQKDQCEKLIGLFEYIQKRYGENDDFNNKVERHFKFKDSITKLQSLSQKVAEKERVLFDLIARQQPIPESDPCLSFKF